MQVMQLMYSKVTEKEGTKRIWIEGGRLAKAGFLPGEAYRSVLDLDRKELRLELDLFGDRRVSGRKRRSDADTERTPIVDLCSAEVTGFVGSAERVKITFSEGVISIRLHHECVAKVEREARFKRGMEAGELVTGTLCAGGGISTAALHDGLMEAGIEAKTAWVVDVDIRYLEVADKNNHALDEDTKIVVATIEELAGDDLEPVDILNVSLPCTIHSRAGKSKLGISQAEEDETITSVFGLLSVVRAVRPSVIVSENVVEAKKSAAYMMIRAELKRLGYTIEEMILDETVGGSIEARKRYWFVAVSQGLGFFDASRLPSYQRLYNCVGDALDPIPRDSDAFKKYEYLDAKEVRDIAKGSGFRRNIVDESAEKVGVIGRQYFKCRSTEPQLKGEDGKTRLFTVGEACRMKRIPEHLVQGCLPTLGHEIQGQSILYGHGWAIGSVIACMS